MCLIRQYHFGVYTNSQNPHYNDISMEKVHSFQFVDAILLVLSTVSCIQNFCMFMMTSSSSTENEMKRKQRPSHRQQKWNIMKFTVNCIHHLLHIWQKWMIDAFCVTHLNLICELASFHFWNVLERDRCLGELKCFHKEQKKSNSAVPCETSIMNHNDILDQIPSFVSTFHCVLTTCRFTWTIVAHSHPTLANTCTRCGSICYANEVVST